MSRDEKHPGARASRPHKPWRSFTYLHHLDQPGKAPFPDHCVKDAPGLYPIITPPLSGSLMR